MSGFDPLVLLVNSSEKTKEIERRVCALEDRIKVRTKKREESK
jgi:hypothetical protein